MLLDGRRDSSHHGFTLHKPVETKVLSVQLQFNKVRFCNSVLEWAGTDIVPQVVL